MRHAWQMQRRHGPSVIGHRRGALRASDPSSQVCIIEQASRVSGSCHFYSYMTCKHTLQTLVGLLEATASWSTESVCRAASAPTIDTVGAFASLGDQQCSKPALLELHRQVFFVSVPPHASAAS
jgi:hypothetical protein